MKTKNRDGRSEEDDIDSVDKGMRQIKGSCLEDFKH